MADESLVWKRELMGRFVEPDLDAEAHFMEWLGYQVKTEEYDRTLPGAFHDRWPDEWFPNTAHMHLSRQFDLAERAKLSKEAREDRQAEQRSMRGTHSERKAILAKLEAEVIGGMRTVSGTTQ